MKKQDLLVNLQFNFDHNQTSKTRFQSSTFLEQMRTIKKIFWAFNGKSTIISRARIKFFFGLKFQFFSLQPSFFKASTQIHERCHFLASTINVTFEQTYVSINDENHVSLLNQMSASCGQTETQFPANEWILMPPFAKLQFFSQMLVFLCSGIFL